MKPTEVRSPEEGEVTVSSSLSTGESTSAVCTRCGRTMHFAGPEGGCFQCLLDSALEEEDSASGDPANPIPPGGDRFGHLEIVRRADGSLHELGRGSMGVSYLARDTALDCLVALKVIDVHLSSRADARARFLREARAAAQLRHPNVASVFHYGETGAKCFYAMEFIEGETLETRVRRDGPLSPAQALDVAIQIANALSAADARGIVHRDLKPSNLMVSANVEGNGTGMPLIKVIDFGLATSIVAGAPKSADLTRGGFVGTPAFASPEQFTSAPGEEGNGHVDTRSDIYSLGVTLWYLLTGKVPFLGGTLDQIHARQLHRVLPLEHLTSANVPSSIVTLLRGMLAPDPADRPQNPRALLEQLRQCLEQIGPAPASVAARRKRIVLGLAALVAAGVLVVFGLSLVRRSAPVPTTEERSVAVLPFENFSEDKENIVFADGVHDAVITSLAKIRDLKVIGRASVMGYRGATGAAKLREIGRALDVRTLLEGSVRRTADRIIISARLLDPRDGRQLWGETYDRNLRDAIAIEGELAREIAVQLHATITPEERARLDRPSTENADAYALYLRGTSFVRLPTREDKRTAIRLLEQTTALDQSFALAWAQLAIARSALYQMEPTEELRTGSLAAAEEALRLRPDQAEAYQAMGACHFINKDFRAALDAFALAVKFAPNNPRILSNIATVQSRQGLWREARAGYERAAALSPQESLQWFNLAVCLRNLRDWPAVVRAQDRAVALAPDLLNYRIERALTDFRWKGDLAPLKAVLAKTSPGEDPNNIAVFWRYQVALNERDYAAAEAALDAFPGEWVDTRDPKSFRLGRIYQLRGQPGDVERAAACFHQARKAFEDLARKVPDDHRIHSYLGLIYACLGWREAALGETDYALALCPESKDAIEGTYPIKAAVLVYAQLGEVDAALPLIEHLLAVPTTAMNLQTLRVDPDFDGLRGDPRFAAIGERAGVPFQPPPKL